MVQTLLMEARGVVKDFEKNHPSQPDKVIYVVGRERNELTPYLEHLQGLFDDDITRITLERTGQLWDGTPSLKMDLATDRYQVSLLSEETLFDQVAVSTPLQPAGYLVVEERDGIDPEPKLPPTTIAQILIYKGQPRFTTSSTKLPLEPRDFNDVTHEMFAAVYQVKTPLQPKTVVNLSYSKPALSKAAALVKENDDSALLRDMHPQVIGREVAALKKRLADLHYVE